MKLDVLAFVLGTAFTITGVFAFFSPEVFFGLLGDYYGVFNSHFVKDAGIAFFSSGGLILLSCKISKWSVPLTLGGSLFIILHALFHVQMLAMGMAPTVLDLAKELIIIIGPSVATAILLVLRIRHEFQTPGTQSEIGY